MGTNKDNCAVVRSDSFSCITSLLSLITLYRVVALKRVISLLALLQLAAPSQLKSGNPTPTGIVMKQPSTMLHSKYCMNTLQQLILCPHGLTLGDDLVLLYGHGVAFQNGLPTWSKQVTVWCKRQLLLPNELTA